MVDTFGRDLVALLPNLRRFALSICRSGDLADDLVQRTCEKALANRSSFKPGTRMDAWLFRILRNTWLDDTRRRRARGPHAELDEAGELPGDDGAAVAEGRLLLAATAKAIAGLPDEQRQLLVLVCVEELSYKDAAAVLGIPLGTVMSRLSRARLRLAEEVGINSSQMRSSPSTESNT